ncbi:conserved hypothetical protein [Rhodobacteraceae bacterium KLH11]|nr:conserved hypothetical protein [Rhodobacteraceae bacterium KLH11]
MKNHGSDEKGCWSRLPVYRAGGRLTAEQLDSEQKDSDLRERLLNLALHGTGVVHGFDASVGKDGCLHVGCGLALDRWGRTLYTDDRALRVNDLVESCLTGEGCYTLSVHYAEQNDRAAWNPCEDNVSWRHRCVAFRLTRGCCETDNCPQCPPPPSCDPRRTYVCERTGMIAGRDHQAHDLKQACAKPPALSPVGCEGLSYDPEAGIPLACIAICRTNADEPNCKPEYGFCPCPPTDDDCGSEGDEPVRSGQDPDARETAASQQTSAAGAQRPVIGDGGRPDDECSDRKYPNCDKPTSCDMRPVAYRAPLLYELINDADVNLPKVKDYSWKYKALGQWDTRMSLEDFAKSVTTCTFTKPKGSEQEKCSFNGDPKNGFWVTFDRPVDSETLHPLSVLMEVYIRENRTNQSGVAEVVNWKHHRVPLVIKKHTVENDETCATGFHLCISEAWLDYIIGDIRACASDGQLARVEITLRGQAIRDKCGCMMDAQPVELECRDHCGKKTGQSRPGGDWISTFRVGPGWPGEDDDDRREYRSNEQTRDADQYSADPSQNRNQDEGRYDGFISSR